MIAPTLPGGKGFAAGRGRPPGGGAFLIACRTDPGGVQAISRWLSVATPPVNRQEKHLDPGGVVAWPNCCDPSGVVVKRESKTPGARSATRG